MCVGLQMKLKFRLTYILLTVSTILAEDIYSRQSERNDTQDQLAVMTQPKESKDVGSEDQKEDTSELKNIGKEMPKVLESDRIIDKYEQNHENFAKTKPKREVMDNSDDTEDKPLDPEDDDSEIFEDIERNFNFDEMGSDVSGYDQYHGSPDSPQDNSDDGSEDEGSIDSRMQHGDKYNGKHKNKWPNKKKGPPRYPPLDKDKLYEVGLLAYMRDFHLGMII